MGTREGAMCGGRSDDPGETGDPSTLRLPRTGNDIAAATNATGQARRPWPVNSSSAERVKAEEQHDDLSWSEMPREGVRLIEERGCTCWPSALRSCKALKTLTGSPRPLGSEVEW